MNKLLVFVWWGAFMVSCSHSFDSNVLDLSFYQWNQWLDKDAVWDENLSPDTFGDNSGLSKNPPSCGWEVLHRGNGKLVRIPSTLDDYKGVSWYHSRFTLPELWEERKIVFSFEGAGPATEVYLNEILVGYHLGINTPFEVNVTDQIYYTRDNHLSVRITDPHGGGGISGNISVRSSEKSHEL